MTPRLPGQYRRRSGPRRPTQQPTSRPNASISTSVICNPRVVPLYHASLKKFTSILSENTARLTIAKKIMSRTRGDQDAAAAPTAVAHGISTSASMCMGVMVIMSIMANPPGRRSRMARPSSFGAHVLRGQDRLPHCLRPECRHPPAQKAHGLPACDERDRESRRGRGEMRQLADSAPTAEALPAEAEDTGKELPEPAGGGDMGVDQPPEPVRVARLELAQRRAEVRPVRIGQRLQVRDQDMHRRLAYHLALLVIDHVAQGEVGLVQVGGASHRDHP